MSTKKIYDIVIGDHAQTRGIKDGTINSPLFDLRFTEIKPTHNAFKPMIREQKFDICEMAIVTYLLAKEHGKPINLLPAVLIGRFQQPFAVYSAKLDLSGPGDIANRRVGVRSYTTTTVTWLRGHLQNDYGADLDSAHWISFEDPHVAEYVDPTERAPAGRTIIDMLLDEELDVVLGDVSDDPRVRKLFDDPKAASDEWYARNKVVPVNHMVVVSDEMVENNIDAVADFYRMLKDGKAATAAADPDPTPIGLEAVRPTIDLLLKYAAQQGVVSRRYSVDELFDERVLKAIGE